MPQGFAVFIPLVLTTISVQLYTMWQTACLRAEYEALLHIATQDRYPEHG